jgi:hypothetical protein
MQMLRRLEYLFIILIAAGILLPLSPIYHPVPSDDPSVYLYVGQRILDGGVPYRDAWDHKQPLTYFIFALGQAITPHSLWGMWLIELLFLTTAGVFGLRLMEGLSPHPVGFLSSVMALLALTPILWGYSLEELALPFQILTLYALRRILTARRESERLAFYALAGGLTGACFFLKQSLVAAGLSVLLYLVLRMLARREWRILSGLAAAAAGFGAVAGIFIAYLGVNGSLVEYREAAFDFNLLYANLGPAERFNALLDALENLAAYPALFLTFALWIACAAAAFLQAGPLIASWTARRAATSILIAGGAVMALLSLAAELDGLNPGLGLGQVLLLLASGLLITIGLLLRSARQREKVSAWLAAAPLLPGETRSPRVVFIHLAAIFFPVALLLMTLSGRHYVYYLIALVPAGWLLIGLGCGLLLQQSSPANARAIKVTLCAIALALAYNPILLLASQYRAQRSPSLPEIVEYVENKTRPDETILVWGKDTTYVYFATERKAPSRYFYQAALELEAYNRKYGAAAEVLQDLQQSPPALFLIPGDAAQPGACPLPVSAEENTAGRIFQFICERYAYETGVSGFQVYRYLK